MAPAKFSASSFLDDIRRYGATYMNVGKPLAYILATPERPDDADNYRCGSRSATRQPTATSTNSPGGSTRGQGRLRLHRERRHHHPRGGHPGLHRQRFSGGGIYNSDTLSECEVARFDADGALTNADEAVGELVNTTGTGFFTGYYNDPAATAERMRHGMYWSGDLAYRDADGWIYLAGRTADWMRVDGENLAAAPIERSWSGCPTSARSPSMRSPTSTSATR